MKDAPAACASMHTMTKESANTTALRTAIRRARGARTQGEFALSIGCSRRSVAHWEAGAWTPTHPKHIVALHAEGVPANLLNACWLEDATPTHDAHS